MKIQTLLMSACFVFALAGCKKAAVAEIKTEALAENIRLDDMLSRAVSSGNHVGVSALAFDEGQTVYTGAFGLADREREIPVDMDTVFRIYSMTKPITSTVIMDLQEEGKLDINDPVSKYIPELADMKVMSAGEDGAPVLTAQINPMTIKDLLLHRAGLGYGIFGDVNPIETMYGKAELFNPTEDLSVKMTKLSKLPLLAQPGEGWYYSYSIDVLGRIIEIVEGKTLGESFEARIFRPLGMSETGFLVRPDQEARFATNYFLTDDGNYVVQDDSQTSEYLNEDNTFQSGGGGLVGTIGDYAKFAQMMLDGGTYNGHRVLEASTVKAMMTNQMDPDDKFMMPWLGGKNNSGFGYGGSVELNPTPQQMATTGRYSGQWGWGGAARTHFWIDPKNNAFGIIMLQYFGQEDPALHAEFRALVLEQTRDDIEN